MYGWFQVPQVYTQLLHYIPITTYLLFCLIQSCLTVSHTMILSPYGKCSLRPLGRANRDEEVLKNLTLLTGDEGP